MQEAIVPLEGATEGELMLQPAVMHSASSLRFPHTLRFDVAF